MEVPYELKTCTDSLELIQTGEIKGFPYCIWKLITPIPYCLDYLWCCDIKWNYANSLEKALIDIEQIVNEIKLYIPKELYYNYYDYEETGSNVYELLLQISVPVPNELLEEQTMISIKYHSAYQGSIKSIWFDENPVMLWFGYGNNFFITDKEKFIKMKIYALNLMEINYPVIPYDEPCLKYYDEVTLLSEIIVV